MGKISDSLHNSPIKNFDFSGDFDTDVNNFIKHENIAPYNQDLDENNYVFMLYSLSFGKKITVHTLTDGVIGKVKHTKIGNIPNEIPKYMKQPFLFEAQNDKTLFDDIQSIGGFIYKNEIFLIIGTKGDKFYCQRERSSFDGRKIDDINFIYNTKINYGKFIDKKNRKDTFAFITTISLMLEAERTPLLIDNKLKKSNKKSNKKYNESEWIMKRIYIDKNIKYENKSKEQDVLDKDGKQLKDVTVSGYLRKQHYGKEHLQTKWIYINSFDSKRWVSEKDTKITIAIYENK